MVDFHLRGDFPNVTEPNAKLIVVSAILAVLLADLFAAESLVAREFFLES